MGILVIREGREGREDGNRRDVPSMFSSGVGPKEVVCRPARCPGRRVVMEWGLGGGLGRRRRDYFFYFSLNFRRLN
jgi:hypothetical protein